MNRIDVFTITLIVVPCFRKANRIFLEVVDSVVAAKEHVSDNPKVQTRNIEPYSHR